MLWPYGVCQRICECVPRIRMYAKQQTRWCRFRCSGDNQNKTRTDNKENRICSKEKLPTHLNWFGISHVFCRRVSFFKICHKKYFFSPILSFFSEKKLITRRMVCALCIPISNKNSKFRNVFVHSKRFGISNRWLTFMCVFWVECYLRQIYLFCSVFLQFIYHILCFRISLSSENNGFTCWRRPSNLRCGNFKRFKYICLSLPYVRLWIFDGLRFGSAFFVRTHGQSEWFKQQQLRFNDQWCFNWNCWTKFVRQRKYWRNWCAWIAGSKSSTEKKEKEANCSSCSSLRCQSILLWHVPEWIVQKLTKHSKAHAMPFIKCISETV